MSRGMAWSKPMNIPVKSLARASAATLAAFAVSVTLLQTGCGGEDYLHHRTDAPPVDPQDHVTHTLHPALLGTIGQYAVLADSAPIPVEGYGVVAYLPHTGSGDADPRIREMLINQLVVKGLG